MEQLAASLDNLIKQPQPDTNHFYTTLSRYQPVKDDENTYRDKIIRKVYYLYEKQILRKDLVYLALLANENFESLNRFIDYDKSVFVLDFHDPVSLYNYCLYKNNHWLYEAIENPNHEKFTADQTIHTKLLLLKFIQLTNLTHVDIAQIRALAPQINTELLDDFWKFYIAEVNRAIDTIHFCNLSDEPPTIFQFAIEHTVLDTLSEYTDLGNHTQWGEILAKLTGEPHDIFTAYVILATAINLVIHNNYQQFPNNVLDDIQNKLINLKDRKLQVEVLENIFSLIFHRDQSGFTCREKEVKLILFLLKAVMDELKVKRILHKDSEEHAKLNHLNICVSDALWRLDLVTSVKTAAELEDRLLNYMLAPPESLIHLCLKRENFERAYQVIEIFNLRETDIAYEVKYYDAFQKFRKVLRNTKSRGDLAKIVGDFTTANPPPKSDGPDFQNQMFLLDLAFTQARTKEDCETILNLVKDPKLTSNYAEVYSGIVELFRAVSQDETKISISEILLNPKYPLDVVTYRTKRQFRKTLGELYDNFLEESQNETPGILNKNHPTHKTLIKINTLCCQYLRDTSNYKEGTGYLLRVYNYLQAFSRILYIEENTSAIVSRGRNTSVFELLNYNRSELTGKLLFERNLDPAEFEKYFGKMKLDFLYHVVGNCFPTINLHVQENITIEELYHDNMLYIPSQAIIVYIQKRNWLLAFILNEMYKVEGVKIDISEARLRTFFNYMQLRRIGDLAVLFEGNRIVAALQNCISAQKVKSYLQEHIVKQDLVSIASQNSNSSESLETAEEVLEETKITNWRALYDVIQSIPEDQMRKKSELRRWRDNILVNLVQDGFDPENSKFIRLISNRALRIETILTTFKKLPGSFACDIIKIEITRFDRVEDLKIKELREWLQKIELHEQLRVCFNLKSWYKSYDFCQKDPDGALQKVVFTTNIDLMIDFLKICCPDLTTQIDTNYLTKVIELNVPLPKIKTLLDTLPFDQSIAICNNLLSILRNLNHLQFVTAYLSTNTTSDDASLKNVQLCLRMLSVFTEQEQEQLFCLITNPLAILEVLIMNARLDKLGVILDVLKDDDAAVSSEAIDSLLRTYAEKSLDFRVVTQPNPRLLRTPEHKLMQSVDSLNLGAERAPFSVPDVVPSKEEWVQNEEVLECMACRQVTFSMFNRRHHCRRCGRVVCYGCSTKRMLVPSYGDILVRVCSECFEGASAGGSERSDPSNRSFGQENWLLNDDSEHNAIVRGEFSYEHAPSISLCLAILKYHSKSVECPKFLLQQCESMLKLLHPVQEPTQEIDYLLVIKMLKSLATAAKLLSTEHMLSSGASSADRILSQAELLALLAERGCLNLMPPLSSHSTYVDASILRRLRDKLLQREQWNLALEVSTKAGLDNAGVFAAWGKSCLKAGSLLLAREKFQRCLDKNSQYENLSHVNRFSEAHKSSDSLNMRTRISSRVSTLSGSSDGRPALRDPPLLNEIVQILEGKTRILHPKVLEKANRIKISASVSSLNQLSSFTVHTDTALSIMNRIKNLKEISSGNYDCFRQTKSTGSRPNIDPIFYEECVFYLSKYGTNLSLLEFFVRHGDVDKALLYILENRLAPDVFIDIYMKCLRDGVLASLYENMSKVDSSLDVWRDYLKHICRHLEKQHLWNCLYQLQLYIGDYVRAAMTCIRFYSENVKNFSEMVSNVRYLQKAELHLKQVAEQEQWVEVTSVGSLSNESRDSFEEKLLTNPNLVMKIDAKDVARHINTVKRQIETANFLAQCEAAGSKTADLLKDLLQQDTKPPAEPPEIPTLFSTTSDKITLAALALISAPQVEDGFPIAAHIIQDYKLRPIKVYCAAGKQFAKSENYKGIMQLVNCIKSSGVNDAAISEMLDEMLTQAVGTLIKAHVTGTKVEDLIKLIKDRATKISAYIEAKQLKTAYFLAVKYKRMGDLRRIQREAELLNMPAIKTLCQKVLQNYAQAHPKDP